MRIKLNEDVKTEFINKGKNGYTVAHVNYEGAKYPFKVMSFSNPATFEVLKNAKAGQEFEIESVKEGQYFQWKSAKPAEADTSPVKATTYTPGKSTYETPEERALRQRLIVRQSSIGHALEYFALKGIPDVMELTPSVVTRAAEEFHDWVYEAPDLFNADNDIPF